MKSNTLEATLNLDQPSDSYIPLNKYQLFKRSKSFDLEYFYLTFYQRIIAFLFCLILGAFCFVYSFFNIFSALINPIKFALPYAISNYLFFTMFGFLFGFKSYFRKIFSGSRRPYTLSFILCTIFTIYAGFAVNYKIIHLVLCIGQIVTFMAFLFSFLPGGTDGLASMMSLVLKR